MESGVIFTDCYLVVRSRRIIGPSFIGHDTFRHRLETVNLKTVIIVPYFKVMEIQYLL